MTEKCLLITKLLETWQRRLIRLSEFQNLYQIVFEPRFLLKLTQTLKYLKELAFWICVEKLAYALKPASDFPPLSFHRESNILSHF